MTDTTRVAARVTGTVQGVGFRWFVREAARRDSLAGWVRNDPDGAVVLELEGPPDRVARMLESVRQGPAGACVERVELIPPGSGALPVPFAVHR